MSLDIIEENFYLGKDNLVYQMGRSKTLKFYIFYILSHYFLEKRRQQQLESGAYR